ncbi:hypothetical protein [Flavobacterium sp. SORGH_AS_0622]|jgi:hypothetical protein|uniref:hypothetical protein n=1 Tax=Flavobacterium sp. SORGH_AS_0622 TaxID=3041772 RepID=UPI00277F6714|nr:hypothetical protein [Flavobacterium sp. SORGH_AS_0622]MDQ1167776.1 hypothetical protein [Flavobacterium sp. SORGH_AS_0622]
MIKSYKIILIVQFFILVALGFTFYKVEYDEYFSIITKIPLFLIGFFPLILLGISILVQRLVLTVIYSDSSKNHSEKEDEDRFWTISFFTYVIFGSFMFLTSLIAFALSFRSAAEEYKVFILKLCIFIVLLIAVSLIIGLFLKVKEKVNEVSKMLSALMIFLSLILFGGAFFIGVGNMATSELYLNVMFDAIKVMPLVDERLAVIDSSTVEDTEVIGSGMKYVEDYYGFRDMNTSNIKSTGFLRNRYDEEYSDSRISNEIKFFFADFLYLRKNQSLTGYRNETKIGLHADEYVYETKFLADKLRENPDVLRDAYESYRPILFALLSRSIYNDSNVDLLIEVLISSRDDISRAENENKGEIEVLDMIYKTMTSDAEKEFPNDHFSQISPFVSKKTWGLIKRNSKQNRKTEYNTKATAVWIYSFWARRNQEGNMDVTYAILKDVKKHYEVIDSQ